MQVCLGAHHVCSHAHPHQGFRHSQRDEHHYSDSTTSTIIVTSVLNAIIIVRSVISISMVVIDIFSIVTSSITLVTTLAPMLYDLNIPPRPATLPTASMEPPVPAAWVSCSGVLGPSMLSQLAEPKTRSGSRALGPFRVTRGTLQEVELPFVLHKKVPLCASFRTAAQFSCRL